jgi:O-antigen/teichoic acid export membrane protein
MRNIFNLQSRWSDPEKKGILRGTVDSFLIQGVSVALVLAGNLLLTRWAGADAYGQYVHVFNWVSLLSVAVIGGRDDLVFTEITRYHTAGEEGRIGWFIRRTNGRLFLAALVIGIAFIALIFLFPIATLHEYRFDLLIAFGAVYFTAFLTLNQTILQTLNYIRLSQVVDRLVRPFLLILFFGLALLLGHSADSRSLIILAEASLGVSCVLLGVLVLGKTRVYLSAHATAVGQGAQLLEERLTKKAMHFFLITELKLFSTKICMLILPYFAMQKDIGVFNICSRLADLVIYPFFLMHAVLPQLFARHTLAETSYKQSLYSAATKLMTVLGLPLILIEVVGGRFFLGLFGTAFPVGYSALVLLSVSQFLYSLFGPANTILMMQNQEKQAVRCLVIYVVLLTVLNLLLVPVWGITGGAVSMLVGTLVYNGLLAVQAYRISGVCSPFLSFLVRPRS